MTPQPLGVRPIGRLHFIVASRSRPHPDFNRVFGPDENLFDLDATEHNVDLEPVTAGGVTYPYWCSCERFNEHPDYHGTPCHHLERALIYVQTQTQKMNITDQSTPTKPPLFRLYGRKYTTAEETQANKRPSERMHMPFRSAQMSKDDCEESQAMLYAAEQCHDFAIAEGDAEPVFQSDLDWDEAQQAGKAAGGKCAS